MPIYQMLLALHIEYKRQLDRKCENPKWNVKSIPLSHEFVELSKLANPRRGSILFNGGMHKSSFTFKIFVYFHIWVFVYYVCVFCVLCVFVCLCVCAFVYLCGSILFNGVCINHPLPFKIFADLPWVAISLFPQQQFNLVVDWKR